MKTSIILGVGAALASLAMSAQAATIGRTEIRTAAMVCQPATAVADGGIRKRPAAVQNEGTSTVSVTCGAEGIFGAQRFSTFLGIGLKNNTGAPITLTCTLVDLGNGFAVPTFFPKSATISANGTSEISWLPSDNAGNNYIYPSFSCALPPGSGVMYTARQYNEEIGN